MVRKVDDVDTYTSIPDCYISAAVVYTFVAFLDFDYVYELM